MIMPKLWFLEEHIFICSYFGLYERPCMCARVITSLVIPFYISVFWFIFFV